MTRQRGFGLFHIILIILIVAIGSVSWKTYQKTQAEAEIKARLEKERNEIKKSISDLETTFEKWSDADKIASSAPRVALAGPVARLQEIKRETAAMNFAPCLANAKTALVEGMSLRIDAYVSFMQQRNLADDMIASIGKFREFEQLMLVCKEK
jgi:Tfp pilus assembly protein PilE